MLLLFVVLPIAVSIAVSSSSVASSLAFCWMCTKSSEDDEVVGDEDIIFIRLQLLRRRRDDDNDSSRALIITLFCHKAMTQTCNVVLSSCPHCHCCFERFCKSGFEIGVLSHRYLPKMIRIRIKVR